MTTGRLITLEGGEGAGKSTVLGEAVREIVLDPVRRNLCAESELLLMFAARAQLVRELIRPALDAGQWVVSDRFTDASYAYQGAGRGQPEARIAGLEAWAAGIRPDLTLLLDLPIAEGLARAGGRGSADRIELESADFFERVRSAYRARAVAEPARFRVIDATQGIEDVRAAACAAIDAFVEAQGRPA
jgi:dTMP kinase